MPTNRTFTSQEIDDGWFLEPEPTRVTDEPYESYELSWNPECFGMSAQFSEAYAAMLEGRPQREVSSSSRAGLKPFGVN